MNNQMRTGRKLNRFGAACILAMLAGLVVIPATASAGKYPFVGWSVDGTYTVNTTDPPPGHGSTFPVTVSGKLTFTKVVKFTVKHDHGRPITIHSSKKEKAKRLRRCQALPLPFLLRIFGSTYESDDAFLGEADLTRDTFSDPQGNFSETFLYTPYQDARAAYYSYGGEVYDAGTSRTIKVGGLTVACSAEPADLNVPPVHRFPA